MPDEDGENQRFDEERVSAMVEGVVQLIGLLQSAKLDFDTPTRRIELGDLNGIELLGTDIGDDQAPTILDKPPTRNLGPMALGVATALAAVLLGLSGGKPRGDESTRMSTLATDPNGHIKPLGGGLSEDLIKENTLTVETGEARW